MSVFGLVTQMDCVSSDHQDLVDVMSVTHTSSSEVVNMEKSDLYYDILAQLRKVSADEECVPTRSFSTNSIQHETSLSTQNFEQTASLPSIGMWSSKDLNSPMELETRYTKPENVRTDYIPTIINSSQPDSSPSVLSLLEMASAYRSQRCQSLPSTQQIPDLFKRKSSPSAKRAQASAPVYKRVASMGDSSSTMYEIIGDTAPLVQINRRDPEELKRLYICPESCGSRYEYWRSLQHHLVSKHGLKKKKSSYPQFASLTG
ncbi:hypothetical protein SARC_08941 [Sphaeroforma arctica JP610]|uniref:C2H2-type domain-containing protein n=1 Tax=Sphaeroforma arctica JP610 TaxID=667725 RepID=A0A0L0FRP5_9EUKA|nr:hypothetical protein SARC_08941 [Sphaeroforma arctica JP610]KNC78633.1 hypothetical protein SARC_08941 [Sphaeroforma arctica JP610]|eukprot:XP_014152535.1 hypothetical protein SARC_08941 [Sphaeroforma arctica JP610]